MRIAIPVFGPRVSPRFDYAPGLLFFTVENGEVIERGEISLTPLNAWQRLEQLRELGIQSLICGGIDGQSAQMLTTHGIQVIAWVAGEAEEAIDYFLRGELKPGSFLYPRCRRNRHRLRKGKF